MTVVPNQEAMPHTPEHGNGGAPNLHRRQSLTVAGPHPPASLTTEPKPHTPLAAHPEKFVAVPVNDPSLADDVNAAPTHPIAPAVARGGRVPHIRSLEQYKEMHARSVADPAGFFAEKARELLHWHRDFGATPQGAHAGGFAHGDFRWFAEGELNVHTTVLTGTPSRRPTRWRLFTSPTTLRRGR